jgi:ATP-dependent exoDNAse (exonuclease V) alpha subunit
MEVVLTAPDRRILVPLGRTDESQDSGGDDDNEVLKANGCRWDLAYCCTTHKYQGSEGPVVIVVLDAAGLLSSRELLYTAISRAKQLCVLIGPGSEITRHLNRTVLPLRKTFLAHKLKGECDV